MSMERQLTHEGRMDYDRRRSSMADLIEVGRSNPIVRAYHDKWTMGYFENIESALFAMAKHLTMENESLRRQVSDLSLKTPLYTPRVENFPASQKKPETDRNE